jgi:hypothetical protein
MKKFRLEAFFILFIVLQGCKSTTDCNQMMREIVDQLESGNLRQVFLLSDSVKKYSADNLQLFRKADSIAQIAERIGLDFNVSEKQVITQIEKRTGSFSNARKAEWENKGWLEWRLINGEKMYFKRAVSNLILIRKFYEQKDKGLLEIASDPDMIFRLNHTGEIVKASYLKSNPVVPVNMKITYTITVLPDAVPDGEIIRCWLPWPKRTHPRQQKTELLSSSDSDYIIAPDSAVHSTIYMESISKKGIPAVFSLSFKYQSYGQYFNPGEIKILPYDKTSEIYKKYTSQQLPQICFTENIKKLADSITDKNDSPDEIVRKIYYWFKNNIPWAGALEYSIMPDIPEYVLLNKRGDCGMQTFLFMSMLRYKGVPVRWQSGWMVPPGAENLHDWCEIYYEGTGWVPSDVSYDLQNSENKAVKEFYLSGIDSYRLILNDGVAGPFHPEKHYLRSEPFDFQRGEVEWSGGNLYFDKWDYDMRIEYLK